MSTEIQNLKDLFVEQGREAFASSRELQSELPEIKKHATNQKLKRLIDREVSSAKEQGLQIQSALEKFNMSPEGATGECSQSILRKTSNLIKRSPDANVRDAAIISSIQRLNHHNIASMGSLAAYAKRIGHTEIGATLHKALEVEKDIDEGLSELAEDTVNRSAVARSM